MEPPGNAEFDRLVGSLDYSMFIVTTAANGQRAGCLVGFTTQSSIDPPRFLVCLSKANFTARLAAFARHLAVHRLGADQISLARVFGEHSGDSIDKFAQCRWHEGPEGLPVLDDCRAWFAGQIVDRFNMGDHQGVLLSALHVAAGDAPAPLMFHDLPPLRPGHPA